MSSSKERQLPASKGCQFRYLTAVGFGSSCLGPGEGTGNIPSTSVILQSPFLVAFFSRARCRPINKINGSNDIWHMIARDWGIRTDFRMVSGNTMPLAGDLNPVADQDCFNIVELRKRSLPSLLCSGAYFLRSLRRANHTISLTNRSILQHLPDSSIMLAHNELVTMVQYMLGRHFSIIIAYNSLYHTARADSSLHVRSCEASFVL